MYPTFRRPSDVVEGKFMGASEGSLASITGAFVRDALVKVHEARAEPSETEE
jgi:hypothetical protein